MGCRKGESVLMYEINELLKKYNQHNRFQTASLVFKEKCDEQYNKEVEERCYVCLDSNDDLIDYKGKLFCSGKCLDNYKVVARCVKMIKDERGMKDGKFLCD